MGIATALCAALTLTVVLRGAPWPRTPVELTALAWALAMLLSAILAEDRGASLPRVAKGLFPALVGLTAFHARTPERGRRGLAGVPAFSGVGPGLGDVRLLLHGARFAAQDPGPVGHYMTFAGQLLLFTSLAAGVALLARDRRWRALALAAWAAGGTALAATYTRSSWLGLAVALAVAVAIARPRWLPVLAAIVV